MDILLKGEIKMKGFIIDCDYLIRVVDYMDTDYPPAQLKKPVKKLYDNDGEKLPIISVGV